MRLQNRAQRKAARAALAEVIEDLARFEVRRNSSVETYSRKYQEVRPAGIVA
jgi:Tfp pilus assembly protein PilE